MAWEKLGTASVGGAGVANNSWKELARITAGSGGSSSLTTSTFTAKENMMILYNSIGADAQIRVGSGGTIDTGANYATRYSENGGSDGSFTSSPHNAYWFASGGAGASGSEHGMGFIEGINLSSFEKLFMANHADNAAGTGASTAPGRYERAMKWANTSAQINIVRMYSSGTMAEGSEIVVLGYDNDEADSGTNFWQELASVELGSDGDLIDSNTFTAKKYLMIEAVGYRTNASIIPALRVGNGTLDTGSNYARRQSVNGGSDGTVTGQSSMGGDSGAGYLTKDVYFIVNKADKEKLIINHCIITGSGAGSAPDRAEIVGKWVNTSAQINRVGYLNVGGGSSDFGAGSYIKVYGAD